MLACYAAAALAAGSDFRHADVVTVGGSPALRIEGRANTYTFSGQSQTSLDVLPDGRFALAWESRRQRVGFSGAYARTFDRDGRPSSGEIATTRDKSFPQLDPSVALRSDGRPYVAYLARFRDGRHTPAYLGDSKLESGKGIQADPLVARGPGGRFIAVWTAEIGYLQTRIFAQLFDAKGKPVGTAQRASGLDQVESTPSIAANDRGFAVVFQRYDERRRSAGLMGRAFDWRGKPLTQCKAIGDPNAIEPSFDTLGEGFVVGWVSPSTTGKFSVAAQRLSDDLAPIGTPIEAPTQVGDQNAVAVAGRMDGRFAFAWNRRTANDSDVYVQLVGSDGNPRSTAFRATRLSRGTQAMAECTGKRRLVYGPTGVMIAWFGDCGLGDAMGANFTLIREEKRPDALAAGINAVATRRPKELVAGKTKLTFDRMAKIVAGPHEPPINNWQQVVNPWGVQIPMANGGFNAYSQTSFTPPDCDIAAGPDHLVVTVNDGIAFYTKDGTLTYMNNMRQTNGFWGQLAASDDFIYDPQTFYDRQTGRFFVMATQGAGTSSNAAALVAVSDDSDPNGTWYLYKFDVTGLAGNFFDSPNFGTDANVLYVTGDGFGNGANYPVYCIEKAPLLIGQQPGIIKSTTLPTSTQSAGIPPVQDSGPQYYMVEHKEGATNTAVDLVAVANPLSNPTFSRFTLAVPAYTAPGDPPQSGSSSRVDTFDARMWSVKFKNGFLWATHHINARTVARWYQIDPRGWPTSGNNPVLVQSGEVDLGATIYTSFPAIAADDGNNAAIGYQRASSAEFYSAAHSTRRMSDAAGAMSGHTIDMVSTGPYTGGRWGDYSGCSEDPVYPGLFWSFGEWSDGSSWRAWVQPLYATNELWANGITTLIGTLISGGYKDLIYDDSAVMKWKSARRPSIPGQAISIELRTRTRRRNQTSAQLQLVYNVDVGGFTMRTSLLNQSTGKFDILDVRAASTSKQTANISVANPSNYVRQSDGAVISRILIEPTGPAGQSSANVLVNRWAWIEN